MNKKLIILIISIILLSTCITTTYSKFTVTSATELSLDFVIEPTYTYYFQVPPDWGSSTVYAYMWGEYQGNTVYNTAYPGVQMDCVDSNLQIYSYTLSTELAYETYGENVFDNIIFSNGKTDAANMKKTVDLNVSGNINGKIYVPELYSGSGTRVFCYGYDPCYLYAWNSQGEKTAWPGEKLEERISDKGFSTILDGNNYTNLIFNKPQDSTNASQTQDLSIPTYQDLTCVIYENMNGAWRRLYYSGNWYTYSTWTETEYMEWKTTDYQGFVRSQQAGY